MIVLNKKGGVLGVILIIFLYMSFFMNMYLEYAREKYEFYKDVQIMEKQKKYEIYLMKYFRYMIDHDILLSDEVEYEGYNFRYVVEVDSNFYRICVDSDYPDLDYSFVCEIDNDNLNVISFEYVEKE